MARGGEARGGVARGGGEMGDGARGGEGETCLDTFSLPSFFFTGFGSFFGGGLLQVEGKGERKREGKKTVTSMTLPHLLTSPHLKAGSWAAGFPARGWSLSFTDSRVFSSKNDQIFASRPLLAMCASLSPLPTSLLTRSSHTVAGSGDSCLAPLPTPTPTVVPLFAAMETGTCTSLCS